MATRSNFLIKIVFFAAIICWPLFLTQAQEVTPEIDRLSEPLQTLEVNDGMAADEVDSSASQFIIQADDLESLTGTVQLIVVSEQPVEVPLSVFVYTGDNALVKQIGLQPSADSTRWQGSLITEQIPNGRYQFKVGYRVLRGAEPTIWSEGYWGNIVNTDQERLLAPITTFVTPGDKTEKVFQLTSPSQEINLATSTVSTTTAETQLPEMSVVESAITDFCARNSITTAGICQQVERYRLNPLCRRDPTITPADCDNYLRQLYEQPLCQAAGKVVDQECSDYEFKQIEKIGVCGQWPELPCATILTSWYRGQAATYLAVVNYLSGQIRQLYNQTLDWQSILKQIDDQGVVSASVPIVIGETNPWLRLIPLKPGALIDSDQDWQAVWPAAFQFDSDNDGLSDDAENRYGSKNDQVDSDNDGYLDGEEVKNGFNPAGSDKLPGGLAGIDRALNGNKQVEQPWTVGVEAEKIIISEIGAFVNGQGLRLKGLAPAMQPVTLFIGSPLPVMATVNADQNGTWEYYLPSQLIDGEHTIYATQIDKEGTITAKSKPAIIYWRQGQLVSLQDLTKESLQVKGVAYDRFGITWPLALGLGLAVIIVGATLIIISWRKS